MFIVDNYFLAVVFCFVTMLCWGSWGNTQKLADLRYDCDADTLLALVHPAGPACHTGERTCFYRSMLER